jgi:L-iditol 2-dehydrogenase
MAKRMGAAEAIDPGEVDPAAQILADTGKRGVDCAIDCAARGDTINQAINSVRNGARVLITGIPSELRVPFEISPMRRKELAIFNVRRSNHEPHAALGLLMERLDLFAPLVTHTRPLDKIEDAFAINEHYADGVGKMVVTPGK